MGKIIWSDSSIEDLEEIEAYISKDSKLYAIRMISRIFERAEVLQTFPMIGHLVPELVNNKKNQQIIEGKYRIIYEPSDGDKLQIIRVLHTARDIKNSGLM